MKVDEESKFRESINDREKEAWDAFQDVVTGFLNNTKVRDYKNVVQRLLKALKKLECNLSIKLHFLFSQLERFPSNFGDVSDEQGGRFHQDLKDIEERYQGRWDSHMMVDYCWSIKRDCPALNYAQTSYKRRLLPL